MPIRYIQPFSNANKVYIYIYIYMDHQPLQGSFCPEDSPLSEIPNLLDPLGASSGEFGLAPVPLTSSGGPFLLEACELLSTFRINATDMDPTCKPHI